MRRLDAGRPLIAIQPELRPQNRGRQHVDLSEDCSPSLSSKKFTSSQEHRYMSEHPPAAFWNGLSEIWLTHQALKELDRRNAQSASIRSSLKSKAKQPRFRSALRKPRLTAQRTLSSSDYLSEASQADITSIKAFAMRGGPDLTDMRGYRDLRDRRNSAQPSSKRRKLTEPCSTPITETKTSITAYDRNFEQHLIDHGVYLDNRAQKPGNWEELSSRLANPRPSLSSSKFSETAFEAFRRSNSRAKNEDDVMIDLIPVISGTHNDFVARKIIFRNLQPITDGALVPANPDLYFGACPEQLNQPARQELSSYIIPSTQEDKPMAPNFYLEAKGPNGASSVAKRQACYDGTVGARAMSKLQSYGEEEPIYDNNAYSLSSTYQDGNLKIYTTHPTQSVGPQTGPEYHLTQLGGWDLTGSRDAFRHGVAAFRNARDWTKEKRDEFISAVNERARNSKADSSTSGLPFQSGQSDVAEERLEYDSQTSIDGGHYTGQKDPHIITSKSTNLDLSNYGYPAEVEEETPADEDTLDVVPKHTIQRQKPASESTEKSGDGRKSSKRRKK